jgi:hypothetical protein
MYAIYKMPNLRVLDFQKVKLKEKLLAKNLFESEKGLKIIEDMTKSQFSKENEEEYIKAIESIQQDINKKKMLYVWNYM